MGTKSILAGLALATCFANGTSHATVITGNAVESINGYDGYVHAYDQSTVELLGGADVAWLYMHEQSKLNFFAGDVSWIHMYGNAQADIFGGTLSWLLMFDASAANIHRSDISWLVLDGNSRADIYGSNFAYSGGHLSGNWVDGTPFSFWALNGDGQGVPSSAGSSLMPENIALHAVPTPATAYLILLALPLLALSRGRQFVKKRALPAGLTAAPSPPPYTA
jgi:hypothetical protein